MIVPVLSGAPVVRQMSKVHDEREGGKLHLQELEVT